MFVLLSKHKNTFRTLPKMESVLISTASWIYGASSAVSALVWPSQHDSVHQTKSSEVQPCCNPVSFEQASTERKALEKHSLLGTAIDPNLPASNNSVHRDTTLREHVDITWKLDRVVLILREMRATLFEVASLLVDAGSEIKGEHALSAKDPLHVMKFDLMSFRLEQSELKLNEARLKRDEAKAVLDEAKFLVHRSTEVSPIDVSTQIAASAISARLQLICEIFEARCRLFHSVSRWRDTIYKFAESEVRQVTPWMIAADSTCCPTPETGIVGFIRQTFTHCGNLAVTFGEFLVTKCGKAWTYLRDAIGDILPRSRAANLQTHCLSTTGTQKLLPRVKESEKASQGIESARLIRAYRVCIAYVQSWIEGGVEIVSGLIAQFRVPKAGSCVPNSVEARGHLVVVSSNSGRTCTEPSVDSPSLPNGFSKPALESTPAMSTPATSNHTTTGPNSVSVPPVSNSGCSPTRNPESACGKVDEEVAAAIAADNMPLNVLVMMSEFYRTRPEEKAKLMKDAALLNANMTKLAEPLRLQSERRQWVTKFRSGTAEIYHLCHSAFVPRDAPIAAF